jgi:hypothetical protein
MMVGEKKEGFLREGRHGRVIYLLELRSMWMDDI